MDDFVLNVRQVGSYPLKASAGAADAILLQEGGLGGAYKYTTPLGLLDPLKTQTLTAGSVAVAANLGWVSGPQWLYAGQNVSLIWTDNKPLLTVSPGGSWLDSELSLTSGTVTVTRDPTAPLEVATQQFVLNQIHNSGVRSLNGQTGDVQVSLWDLVQLGVPSAQNAQLVGTATLNGVPIATTADVKTQIETFAPLVNLWNGRAGVVELQLADVMNVFFAGVPITPTPRSSDISQRIANTRWVTDRNEELYGSLWADVSRKYAPLDTPHLIGVPTTVTPDINDNSNQIASTAWVINKLTAIGAGVLTWNNRSGVVNLLWSDVDAVGGAPITSPTFLGNPQAPTRVKTDNSASIATTAFVQSVAGDYLPLVGGTLTGAVTGTALTLSGALGVAGATALAGILGVVGAATFDATLDVTGAVDFADTLDVSGAVNFADTLDVTGVLTGTWANFTTNSAVPAITATSTAAGHAISVNADGAGNGIHVDYDGTATAAVTVVSDGAAAYRAEVTGDVNGESIRLTGPGTGAGIYVLSQQTNGINIERGTTATTGLHVRGSNAGVAGTCIQLDMDAANSVGLTIGSNVQANSAIEVWRWTPDTTRRWWVTHDGATHEIYDGTGSAMDINATGTGNKLLIRAGATNNLLVRADGTLDAMQAVNLAVTSGGVTVGDGTTNTTASLNVMGATQLATFAGDVTIGAPPNAAANLNVRGNVTVGSAVNPVRNSSLTVRGGVDLANTSGNVTIGSIGNNNTFTTWGQANLATQWGGTTVGTIGNFAPLTVWGATSLCTAAGNAAVGSATAPVNTGGLTVIGNFPSSRSPLIVRNVSANNYTENSRLIRASNQWAGIVLGGAIGSVGGVDAYGEGTYSSGAEYPGYGNIISNRATWWIASNPAGDLVLAQGAAMRLRNVGAGGNITPTTLPDNVADTGIYVRRSDSRVFLNGYPEGHAAWRDYTALLVRNATYTNAEVVTRFYSNGIKVEFFIGQSLNGTAIPRASSILTGIPAAMRPNTYVYCVFTTYPTGSSGPGVCGNLGINPTNGAIFNDTPIPAGQGYLFGQGFYFISGNDPPAG